MADPLPLELARGWIRVTVVSPSSILSEGGGWDARRRTEPEKFTACERIGFPGGRLGTPGRSRQRRGNHPPAGNGEASDRREGQVGPPDRVADQSQDRVPGQREAHGPRITGSSPGSAGRDRARGRPRSPNLRVSPLEWSAGHFWPLNPSHEARRAPQGSQSRERGRGRGPRNVGEDLLCPTPRAGAEQSPAETPHHRFRRSARPTAYARSARLPER